MNNMDTMTISEQSATTQNNHTSSSQPKDTNSNIENLYNCLDSGPHIVICKNLDDSKIQIHPMKIGRILYKDHPELNTKNIRKLGNYKFEIEFQYFSGANNFLTNKIDTSLNMKAFIPNTLTHTKGIVKNIDPDITNEEIIEFSSNLERFPITDVHRFTRKIQEADGTSSYVPTKTCLLTFRAQTIPQKIRLFNCSLPVDQYIEKIRQCWNCGKYGHSTKVCRNKTICLNCSNEHSTQECDYVSEGIRNYKCINCGLPHNANASICPVYRVFILKCPLTSS